MEKCDKSESDNNNLHLVIDNQRIDLKQYSQVHPGGQEILKSFKNQDVSDFFNTNHSDRAKSILKILLKQSEL